MAVVNYTLSVAGGVASISPGIDEVVLETGDFMVFNVGASVAGDIFVQITGGPKVVVAAAEFGRKMKLQPPQLDPASGDITIGFTDVGGNPGDSNPDFP